MCYHLTSVIIFFIVLHLPGIVTKFCDLESLPITLTFRAGITRSIVNVEFRDVNLEHHETSELEWDKYVSQLSYSATISRFTTISNVC